MQNTNEILTKKDKTIENSFNELFTTYVKAYYPNIHTEIASKAIHDLQEINKKVFKTPGHDQ